MSYPEIDKTEKEQVQWVFGLTGGELSDRPLRFAEVTKDKKIRRYWQRYWYDGTPDYHEKPGGRWDDGNYITVVECLMLGNWGFDPPRKIITGGKVWRCVAVYTSSGESECPGRDNEHDGIVQEEESKDSERCPLCDEARGAKHGFIYLGDGWAEVVYRTRA